MKSRVPALWMALALCQAAIGQSPPAETPAEAEASAQPAGQTVVPPPNFTNDLVISRSKQFRITGGDSKARVVCSILADDVRDEIMRLLEIDEDWRWPISIVLHGKQGDKAPARTWVCRLWMIDKVYQLQLDKHLAPGIEPERFRNAVTAMLIYEWTLRKSPVLDGDVDPGVPPWLVVGLREASAWRTQQCDRRLYAAMFRQGGAFNLDALFAVDDAGYEKLDPASRLAFQMSAGSMVLALLQQPEGKRSFLEFLAAVATHQGEMPILLRNHFPGLNLSQNSLSKWWSLQLANQGDSHLLTDVMTVAETEEQMARCLFLALPGGPDAPGAQVALTEWPRLATLDAEGRLAAVKPAQAALVHLSYRCFPSYRPLLLEYQKLLIRLGQGQNDAVQRSLEELDQARQVMAARVRRGRDYLDWFEITRARETSGVFDDYLRLKEELKERGNTRKDGMSKYLDRMDALFHRGKE